MKLKVLKSFTDKYTDKAYTSGMEIEVKDKRGEELLAHPLELVEKIEEPAADVEPLVKKARSKKAE